MATKPRATRCIPLDHASSSAANAASSPARSRSTSRASGGSAVSCTRPSLRRPFPKVRRCRPDRRQVPGAPIRFSDMTAAQLISFARGAPSLDIVDVEGLKAAAVRAFDADPGWRHRVRHVRRLPAAARVDRRQARRRGRAGARHQRLAAGRRVPLRPPGRSRATRWWWSGRRTTGRCSTCATRAPRCTQVTIEPDGIDIDELRKLLESGVRPEARARHPELPEPGRRHALAGEAAGAARPGRASTASRSSRTTRTSTSGSAASRCRRCSRSTSTASSCTPPASPRRSARASGSATWSGRRALIADDREDGDQPLHLARHGVRRRSSTSSASPATSTGRSRPCARRWASAPACSPTSLREQIPGVRFTEPDGGYFLWVELPEDVDVDKLAPGRRRARGRRGQGQRLPARRRQALAAAGVLGGHGRSDRRGCPPAGGGHRGRPKLIFCRIPDSRPRRALRGCPGPADGQQCERSVGQICGRPHRQYPPPWRRVGRSLPTPRRGRSTRRPPSRTSTHPVQA